MTATASDASTYGVTAGKVYTRVEWDLGTLAAGSTTIVKYAAAIPLYENTITWDVTAVGPRDPAEPTGTSLEQTANLDNNNGPSTRHGSAGSAIDGTSWTNVANVAGTYGGVVRTDATRVAADDASYTIDAMDLAVVKSVAASDEQFDVGNVADFTLNLRASEYMDSSDIVLTDTLPNGLCPLMPVGTTLIEDSPGLVPDACKVTGTVDGADMVSVTAHADGTYDVVFRPTSATFPNADDFVLAANQTHSITYQALNRASYELDDAYGSTTSGDGFSNSVEVVGVTDAITPLQSTFGDTWDVWDDSAASLSTELTTISKKVLPRNLVAVGAALDADPCTAGGYTSTTQAGFRMGDTACFELRVDFPNSVDTRNPLVTDFLPDGLTYGGYAVASASTVPEPQVSVDVSKTDAGRISWSLGEVGALGDRYVGIGDVFVVHVWATVDAPSNGPILDKPENLMKFQQQNVEGDLYFLRSQAAIEVDPELQLVKGVWSVEDNSNTSSSTRAATTQAAPDGNTFGSNRDGVLVREGEVVTYRLDLSTAPYPADNAVIWDALPDGLDSGDVSNISDGGQVFDPTDTVNYPANIAPALNSRSVVVWTGVSVTDDDVAGVFSKTLSYDVLVPTETGVATSLVNEASIISYTAGINTSAVLAGQVYYPAGAFDQDPARVANTVGDGTRDDSEIHLPDASVAKSITSPTGVNNSASQVVPGEIATATYTVTIPAHTTVKNGILTDVIANAGEWQIIDGTMTVKDPSDTTTAAGATSLVYGGQTFTIDPATGTLTFPATFTNATDDDQTFTVVIDAYITSATAWVHSPGTARTDTATFTSATGSTLAGSADVFLIEPSPSIAKSADATTVAAGQTVTYTLTASNASGRPTLFDSTVEDCVPAALGTVTVTSPASGWTVTPAACGALSANTLITWSAGDILADVAVGTEPELTYTVTVDPTAAGGATYLNVAAITGYSLAATPPSGDRHAYTAQTNETITVEGATLTKSVDEPTATIGEERGFTITVNIPKDVNFYDSAIIDTLPAGMTLVPLSTGITCDYGVGGDCLGTLPGAGSALTPSGTTLGWWLGDVASHTDTRTVTVTYTAVVTDVVDNVNTWELDNTATFRWASADTITGPPADANYTPGQTTNEGKATVTVVEPSVGLVKKVNNLDADTVDPGETFGYTITATNSGTSTAYGVTITDPVPVGVVVIEASISGLGTLTGETANGGGTITWTLASLDTGAGNAVEFTYSAKLAASTTLSGAALTNTADANYFSHPTGPGYDTDERREYDSTQVDADVTPQFPVITVTKAPTGTVAYIDTAHPFTITVKNEGDATASGFSVADTLPAGWVFDANSAVITDAGSAVVSTGAAANPTVVGQVLTWASLPSLDADDPDETFAITYTARPSISATWDATNTGSGFDHTNSVVVTAQDASGATGTSVGPYEDDTTAAVQIHRTDIAIDKKNVGTPVAGEDFSWTLDVTNDAAADAAVGPIVITDTLPATATFVSVAGTGWSGSETSAGVVTLTHAGPLAPGAALPTATITVAIADDVAAGTAFNNSASVTSTTFEADLGDNTDTTTATVTRSADVSIDKAVVGSTFVAGMDFSWEITVSNNGPSVASGPFTVTDMLPVSLDWSTVVTSGTGWTCGSADVDGHVECTWSGSALAVGGDLPVLTLTAQVLPSWTGTLVNTAIVDHPTPDPDTDNNTDTSTVGSLGSLADLSLTKTTASADIPADGTGRFRIEVANAGPSDALNVVVTDTLPAGLTYAGGLTSATGDTWNCVVDSGNPLLVNCSLASSLGTLPHDATSWFEFDVNADSTVTGAVLNVATVTSDTDDPDTSNNTDDSTTPPKLIVNKTVDKGTVARGGVLVYTLNVESIAYGVANAVMLVDTVPAELRVDSIDIAKSTDSTVPDWNACTLTGTDAAGYGGVITCELDGDLSRGRITPDITVTTTVSPTMEPGTLVNTAEVTWFDALEATDPDTPGPSHSATDLASSVVTLTPAELLALTGANDVALTLWVALALLASGLILTGATVRSRRR